ncbi:MAG: transposase [Bryobacterales bacterium]|nr:transposase [Bryobacterales bacterium]
MDEASEEIFHNLKTRQEIGLEEGCMMPDPVQIVVAIPPTSAVSRVVVRIKAKGTIQTARSHGGRKRNLVHRHCGGAKNARLDGGARRSRDPGIPSTRRTRALLPI